MKLKYFVNYLNYVIWFIKFIVANETDKFRFPCDFSNNSISISAYNRAKTIECKAQIADLACATKHQEYLIKTGNLNDGFYKLNLTRLCPFSNNKLVNPTLAASTKRKASKFFIGCSTEDNLFFYINNFNNSLLNTDEEYEKNRNVSLSIVNMNVSNLQTCVDLCLNFYKFSAFNQHLNKCLCLKYLKNEFKQSFLDKNDCNNHNDLFEIYDNGAIVITKNELSYKKSTSYKTILHEYSNKKNHLPKIVFFLTINGRSIRQVFRLIKTIYDDMHFYYIHVDGRMKFLRNKILKFINESNKSNIHLAKWHMSTIWGGASLLQMHLRAFKELIDFKEDNKWNWDFVLNLSETDFPIKSIQELALFLNDYKEKNFVKTNSNNDFEKYAKKQGLEYTFLDCENRMWKINKRTFPIGIQFSGGSDWFVLNAKFVNYLLKSDDEYLHYLKRFYNYTLLPSEGFFHTVLLNSEFCDKWINTNLKFVNWKRDIGCGCSEVNNPVDWCGCSPNYLNVNEDLSYVRNTLKNTSLFFARKFDPMHNNQLINIIDQTIFGLYSTSFKSLNSYWQNIYDFEENTILENKLAVLFEYFQKASIEVLQQDETHSLTIKSVNSYFEADVFKGYVVNVEIKDKINNLRLVESELFFKKGANKDLITLPEKKNITLKSKVNFFLQKLIKIQVSTDFDARERIFFKNYAHIIDQHDNPELLIEFDPLEESVEFLIQWYSSNDTKVKETSVYLEKSKNNKKVLNSLFKKNQTKFIESPGLWRIELKHNEDIILTKKFLVLPNSVEQIDNNIKQFWTIDSMCTEFLENTFKSKYTDYLKLKSFKCDEQNAYWSTFYPDPKADISKIVGIDLNYRIF